MYIYGSYRKINTGVPLFWNTLYVLRMTSLLTVLFVFISVDGTPAKNFGVKIPNAYGNSDV